MTMSPIPEIIADIKAGSKRKIGTRCAYSEVAFCTSELLIGY